MYSSHIAGELARAKMHDQLGSAEAYRLAAAARRARPQGPRRPGWAGIPAAVRGLVPRLLAAALRRDLSRHPAMTTRWPAEPANSTRDAGG
jgi:hypothetical protein